MGGLSLRTFTQHMRVTAWTFSSSQTFTGYSAHIKSHHAIELCRLTQMNLHTAATAIAADTMGSSSLTRSSSDQTHPPRTNLPLPRELRDKTFGYVLQGDPVRQQADATSLNQGHVYDFHTNILAVSKDINEEATQILYNDNTFVLVSYQCPGFQAELDLGYVPTVARSRLAHFDRHCLYLRFTRTGLESSLHIVEGCTPGSGESDGTSSHASGRPACAMSYNPVAVLLHAWTWIQRPIETQLNSHSRSYAYDCFGIALCHRRSCA